MKSLRAVTTHPRGQLGVRVQTLQLACWCWFLFPANSPRHGWGKERLLHLWNERNRLLPLCPPGVRRCLHAGELRPPPSSLCAAVLGTALLPRPRQPAPALRACCVTPRHPAHSLGGFPSAHWAHGRLWLPDPVCSCATGHCCPGPAAGPLGRGGHYHACSISTESMISVFPHSSMGTLGGCPLPATSLAP